MPKGVRLKPEQVAARLREIEVKLSQGKDVLTACREIGGTDKKVIPPEVRQVRPVGLQYVVKKGVFMALTKSDFLLSDEELIKINQYFEAMAEAHAQAGEDAQQSVSVTFQFAPVIDRNISAHFDGALCGRLISDGSEISSLD